MNRISFAVLATTLASSAVPATAQQRDFSAVTIKTTDLGHRTYMLEGEGGNITVAVGADAVIMVDGEFAPLHDKIKAAVAGLTPLPIRYLVNTHFHGDHTGGNAAFARDGTIVVATVNVRERLAAGTTSGLTGAKTPPAAPEALPARVYLDAMALQVKGLSAQLKFAPAAHTDGDTYVWFSEANVIAAGDIVALGPRYPNVDFANGGNIHGLIAAVDADIALVNDATKIVPGHGPLATKADLIAYRAMLATAQERVAKLIADGRTEAQAVAARPFADFDARLGVPEPASANFVRVIYRSLSQGARPPQTPAV